MSPFYATWPPTSPDDKPPAAALRSTKSKRPKSKDQGHHKANDWLFDQSVEQTGGKQHVFEESAGQDDNTRWVQSSIGSDTNMIYNKMA